MAKNERLNEEASLNNNLDSSTIQLNVNNSMKHKRPEAQQQKGQKKAGE